MEQLVFIRNNFTVDTRPRVIANNREHRLRRKNDPKERPIDVKFENNIEFEDFNIRWLGNVPAIQTPKGWVTFISDLRFFKDGIKGLEIDQQGTIEYDARRGNFRYHCLVRFIVSDVIVSEGRKTIYLFFREPMINTIS